MKKINKSKLFLTLGTAAFITSISVTATMASPIMSQGKPSYIMGGIGDSERYQLEAQKTNYDLHVTNADKDGNFTLADNLKIRDPSGKTLISANNVDPIFYASLPPGYYTIDASYGDKHEVRKIFVSDNKPANLHLVW
jgi:hypothetical protein